jgi:predicted RNA-binding protein YlxR (DUF448 family)
MSKTGDHVPLRTCISCRSKKDKKELVRLVLDMDNRVIIDELQKKNGRGIYLCDDKNCKDRFLKSKRPGRFFRTDKAVTIGFD